MASWASIAAALATSATRSRLEATSRFKGEGGPLLNLLKAPRGVYLVSLLVIVEGSVRNKRCVMLSTMKEKHAFGKLIDNSGKMAMVYLEKKDTNGKEAAKKLGRNSSTRIRQRATAPSPWSQSMCTSWSSSGACRGSTTLRS